jgi:hypothetical protein
MMCVIGVPVFLEPLVGESSMKLIFEGQEGRFASEVVMDAVRIWQSSHEPSVAGIPRQVAGSYGAQSRQTTPEIADNDSLVESKLLSVYDTFHGRSSSIDSSEKVSLTEVERHDGVDGYLELDSVTEADDGICGIVFVLTAGSINWFMASMDETGRNFVSSLMASLKCFIQVLPASCCRISKCVEVRKISLVAPSRRVRKAAVEKILHHILCYRG